MIKLLSRAREFNKNQLKTAFLKCY